ATKSRADFALLQSQAHRVWVSVFSSTMKDDLRYNPQDCFDTFPFPDAVTWNPLLEGAGVRCYDARTAIMTRNREGLTDTYNRFHDPNEQGTETCRFRELKDEMDRAVLDAY